MHVESVETFQNLFNELLKNDKESLTTQYEYKLKNGEPVWVEATGTNLLDDPDIKGIVINSRDITERKRAEREERMRSQMQALSENSPDLITRVNKEGMIYYINPVIKDLTGKSTDNFLNKPIEEVQLDTSIKSTWDSIADNVFTKKEKYTLEMEFPSVQDDVRIMLDQANAGEYFFLDQPVHKFNEKKRGEMHKNFIGFVFQAYHLIDELTVYENIEMPLLYKGVKGSERKSMVAEMLDRFNIVAKKDLFPHQLSGGQQQVVGVARAIIGKPKLLLADEPTGNLHSKQGEMIMDLFKKLNDDGVTIIQVTHSEKNAEYGSRIVTLEDGAIVSDKGN